MTSIKNNRLAQFVLVIFLVIVSFIVGIFNKEVFESVIKLVPRSLADLFAGMQIIIGIVGITLVLVGWSKIQTVLPMAVCGGIQKFRTEGQTGSLMTDVLGNLQSTLATKIAGEDLNYDVMKTQAQGHYESPLTHSALVRPCPGWLYGFVVNSAHPGATIKIVDGANASGLVMFDTMNFDRAMDSGPKVFALPAAVGFATGCYFDIKGTISVTPILN